MTDRAFHIVMRAGRDVRMATVFNSTDETAAREAYQARVNAATAWPPGGKVELRDRFGRVLAAYLSTAREEHTPPDRRRQADRRGEPRPQPNRRHR